MLMLQVSLSHNCGDLDESNIDIMRNCIEYCTILNFCFIKQRKRRL